MGEAEVGRDREEEIDRLVKSSRRGRPPTIAAIDGPTNVLFVCTGNICRSPMAAGMLRARAAARGLAVEVASCGLSLADLPATDEAIRCARDKGADIAAHRSAVLDRALVARADLAIGMERQHVREVLALDRSALGRAFTFKDLVRRAERTGPRSPDEAFASWLDRLGAGRRAIDLVGFDADDEVADPYRRRLSEYERCADEIAGLVIRLADLGWPPDQAEGAA
jgi:protein-tyrosine phosphatase